MKHLIQILQKKNHISINLDNITRQDFIKPFIVRVPNNDLHSEGIFKDDVLTVNPNITAKHGNFYFSFIYLWAWFNC